MENRQIKEFQAVMNANVLIMSTAFDLALDGFPTVEFENVTALLVRLIGPLTIIM